MSFYFFALLVVCLRIEMSLCHQTRMYIGLYAQKSSQRRAANSVPRKVKPHDRCPYFAPLTGEKGNRNYNAAPTPQAPQVFGGLPAIFTWVCNSVGLCRHHGLQPIALKLIDPQPYSLSPNPTPRTLDLISRPLKPKL